jgi:hypothetical protein
MKTLQTALLATLCLAVPAAAQTLAMDFAAIAEKAASKTEINLDGPAMQAALGVFGGALGKLPEVKAVSIHTYEFAKPGEYPTSGLDALRKQVAADPRWSRLLSAHEKDESTDIYVMNQDGTLVGFLLIALEPKEVTVIHGAGSVELAQLREVVSSTIGFDLAEVK